MQNLVTIQNVRGYVDKIGTAYLHLEDVARGLGFVTVATSGNEVIRWTRVEKYLSNITATPMSPFTTNRKINKKYIDIK